MIFYVRRHMMGADPEKIGGSR